MHAKDLLLDDGCYGHGVEAFYEELPQFDGVFSLA